MENSRAVEMPFNDSAVLKVNGRAKAVNPLTTLDESEDQFSESKMSALKRALTKSVRSFRLHNGNFVPATLSTVDDTLVEPARWSLPSLTTTDEECLRQVISSRYTFGGIDESIEELPSPSANNEPSAIVPEVCLKLADKYPLTDVRDQGCTLDVETSYCYTLEFEEDAAKDIIPFPWLDLATTNEQMGRLNTYIEQNGTTFDCAVDASDDVDTGSEQISDSALPRGDGSVQSEDCRTSSTSSTSPPSSPSLDEGSFSQTWIEDLIAHSPPVVAVPVDQTKTPRAATGVPLQVSFDTLDVAAVFGSRSGDWADDVDESDVEEIQARSELENGEAPTSPETPSEGDKINQGNPAPDAVSCEEKKAKDKQVPIHHINFLGNNVYEKSGTTPAVSFWAMHAVSRPVNPLEYLSRKEFLRWQASKWIDPLDLDGDYSSVPPLQGDELRNWGTGRVQVAYQALGLWQSDYYSRDDNIPVVQISNRAEPYLDTAWGWKVAGERAGQAECSASDDKPKNDAFLLHGRGGSALCMVSQDSEPTVDGADVEVPATHSENVSLTQGFEPEAKAEVAVMPAAEDSGLSQCLEKEREPMEDLFVAESGESTTPQRLQDISQWHTEYCKAMDVKNAAYAKEHPGPLPLQLDAVRAGCSPYVHAEDAREGFLDKCARALGSESYRTIPHEKPKDKSSPKQKKVELAQASQAWLISSMEKAQMKAAMKASMESSLKETTVSTNASLQSGTSKPEHIGKSAPRQRAIEEQFAKDTELAIQNSIREMKGDENRSGRDLSPTKMFRSQSDDQEEQTSEEETAEQDLGSWEENENGGFDSPKKRPCTTPWTSPVTTSQVGLTGPQDRKTLEELAGLRKRGFFDDFGVNAKSENTANNESRAKIAEIKELMAAASARRCLALDEEEKLSESEESAEENVPSLSVDEDSSEADGQEAVVESDGENLSAISEVVEESGDEAGIEADGGDKPAEWQPFESSELPPIIEEPEDDVETPLPVLRHHLPGETRDNPPPRLPAWDIVQTTEDDDDTESVASEYEDVGSAYPWLLSPEAEREVAFEAAIRLANMNALIIPDPLAEEEDEESGPEDHEESGMDFLHDAAVNMMLPSPRTMMLNSYREYENEEENWEDDFTGEQGLIDDDEDSIQGSDEEVLSDQISSEEVADEPSSPNATHPDPDLPSPSTSPTSTTFPLSAPHTRNPSTSTNATSVHTTEESGTASATSTLSPPASQEKRDASTPSPESTTNPDTETARNLAAAASTYAGLSLREGLMERHAEQEGYSAVQMVGVAVVAFGVGVLWGCGL